MATSPGARSASPGRRVRMTRDARREQLLDAAARVVVEEGSDGLTMESVALAAGASKTLGYAYFENIADVVLSLYTREAGILAVAVQEAIDGAEAFEDRLRGAARAYLQQMVDKGPLLVALAGGLQAGQFGLRGQRPFDEVLAVIAGLLDEEYGLGPERAHTFSRMLGAVATVHADLLWAGAEALDEAEDELVAFLLGGIRGVLGR